MQLKFLELRYNKKMNVDSIGRSSIDGHGFIIKIECNASLINERLFSKIAGNENLSYLKREYARALQQSIQK